MKQTKNNIQCRKINYSSRVFLTVILSLACVITTKADTSIQARNLINAMSQAADNLSYDGIFVFSRGEEIDTMRIIRSANPKGKVKERLLSMSGAAREVIRDEDGVRCIFSDDQRVMVDKARQGEFLFSQLPEPIEQIAQYYSFNVAGVDRVAGKDAWVVNVVPKDTYRYGYQLWIDKENKLLLKSTLKNLRGKTIEQVVFTSLEVRDDIPSSLLEPQLLDANFTWHENKFDEVDTYAESVTPNWQAHWMPQGFSQTEYEQQKAPNTNLSIEHLIYSDGLALVSVFIEKLDLKDDFLPGLTQMGGVNAFTVSSNGYQVTAVGEVPSKTVQQIAVSIKRRSK